MKRSMQMLAVLFAGMAVLSLSALAQTSGTWTLMNSSSTAQVTPGAAVLPNGKVLYANADGTGHAQIFDPADNAWSSTGNMTVKRNGPVLATRLPNGKVLVAGGWIFKGPTNNRSAQGDTSAELYDPATGTFSATGSMSAGRAGGTITVLTNGKVLVTGGWAVAYGRIRYANCTGAADIYDPTSGTWSAAAPMLMALCGHTATLLPDGRVLVAGGINYYARLNATASIYNPVANTWAATGSMTKSRSYHSAVLLPNGKVLVVDQAADLYDPATGVFTATASASFMGYVMFLLPNGKALLQGYDYAAYAGVSALYDPLTASWTPTGNNVIPRYADTGVQLPDGKVLIVGGAGYDLHTGKYASMTPEMYTP